MRFAPAAALMLGTAALWTGGCASGPAAEPAPPPAPPAGEVPVPRESGPIPDATVILIDAREFPARWKVAESSLQAGAFELAAAKFRAIGDDPRVHPVVRQMALLKSARAAGSSGTKAAMAAADAAYDHLLEVFPATVYIRIVWQDRWRLYSEAGLEDKARDAIEQFLKLPGVTDSDRLQARFALTTLSLRKAVAAKDRAGIQGCLEEFGTLAGETEGPKELSSINALAKIGMGNCMLELGNPSGAKTIFEEMTQREGLANSVYAAAYNGLGECWYHRGDKEGFTEALRCFLRVETLYADEAPSDEIAKAMCFAGDCFARLGDPARAGLELQGCIQKCPNSPWATVANKIRLNLPK